MAQIAESVLLLLLDNESAQPRLRRRPLGRVLAAGLLLDLAYDCRVRPALPGEPAGPGRVERDDEAVRGADGADGGDLRIAASVAGAQGLLVALAGPPPRDPALRPALALLERDPLTADKAIGRLAKRAEDDVLDQLLRTGQIHQIQLSSHRLRRNTYAWPVHDRGRVDGLRRAVADAVAGDQRPQPVTAAVIALLHSAGAMEAVLTLGDADRGRAAQRAAEIATGRWADDSGIAEVNLALTAAAVLPAVT